MLDSLHAVGQSLAAAGDDGDPAQAARDAARLALDTYRPQLNHIGRARMFAEKCGGQDDPGMVAVLRMAQCL